MGEAIPASSPLMLPANGSDLDALAADRELQFPTHKPAPEHLDRCTAHVASTGRRCRNRKVEGLEVCTSHGGKGLAARMKAEAHLAELTDRAASVYEDAMRTADLRMLDKMGDVRVLGPDHKTRMQAADAVLDRTGIGRQTSVDVDVDVSVHFMKLIAELDAQ